MLENLPAAAKVSTAIQDGIVLGADNGLAGGIGTVDSAFAQLGRIVPISGNFPAQPDEIAMTTTLLDALGCSYDLGQTITLKVADNDYDPLSGSGKIVEQTYTLCGVLPAYDVYWNLGSNLTVSAVVVEPLALAGQKFQTFYDLNADTVGTASDDPDFIANEYAYPQEDTVSSGQIWTGTVSTACSRSISGSSFMQRERYFRNLRRIWAEVRTFIILLITDYTVH